MSYAAPPLLLPTVDTHDITGSKPLIDGQVDLFCPHVKVLHEIVHDELGSRISCEGEASHLATLPPLSVDEYTRTIWATDILA